MKTITAAFQNAIDAAQSPGVEPKLFIANLSLNEPLVDRSEYLDIASIGNISERIEKDLNEFKAGDIYFRVFNLNDFFLNDEGTGIVEKDEQIRVMLKLRFRPVPGSPAVITDELVKFDGYIDTKAVQRVGENKIQIRAISWEQNMEAWNAETVADPDNSPFRNITGLGWEAPNTPTIEGGELGVHTLTHTIEGSNHKWQYDSGDRVTGNTGTVEVWNEYKDATGALAQKEQKLTFTIIGALPAGTQTDVIVVIKNPTNPILLHPCYWWENIHLETLVGELWDAVEYDPPFDLDGIISDRNINVRSVPVETGEKVFSYYNSELSSKRSYSCVYIGDDYFLFGLDDTLMIVKREETEALTYEVWGTLSAGLKIYRLWYVNGEAWGIAGTDEGNLTKMFMASFPTGVILELNMTLGSAPTNYPCNLLGVSIEMKGGVQGDKLYYMTGNWGGPTSYTELFEFDFPTRTFSLVKDFASEYYPYAGGCYAFYPAAGNIEYYVFPAVDSHIVRDHMVQYDITNDSISTHLITGFVRGPKVGARCAHSEEFQYIYFEESSTHPQYGFTFMMWGNEGIIRGLTSYPTTIGKYVWAFDSDQHIVKFDSGNAQIVSDAIFIYDNKSHLCMYDTDNEYLFGIGHEKVGLNRYLAWEFSATKRPFIHLADFTDMTIRDALNDLATAFLCTHKRTAYDAAFFYYREYAKNEGSEYNLTPTGISRYYHPPKIKIWKQIYDGVIVTGYESLQWAAGNILWGQRVLEISSRFLDDNLGQSVANWMWNFFRYRRHLYEIDMKFLIHLELQDEVQFKLPWDDATVLKGICYDLEYQSDKHQVRAKIIEKVEENGVYPPLHPFASPFLINLLGFELTIS